MLNFFHTPFSMKYSQITEAEAYTSQLLPLKSDIYRNGSSSYSNFKCLLLNKEISLPKVSFISSGILPEIQAFWYVVQENLLFNLHIFRYDSNSLEVLPNFSSKICFVSVFKPFKGVFSQKIQHCLLITTETDIILYGIEMDSLAIVNTDFSAKLYSKPVCIKINSNAIFLGCMDGKIYRASCKSVDFLNYKYLSLSSAGFSLLNSMISSVIGRKKDKISCISSGDSFLVALSKNLEIFNIQFGIYKIYEIKPIPDVTYIDLQIVEENPLLFYCVQSSGIRDFYSTEYLFSKDPALNNLSGTTLSFSTPSLFLLANTDRSTVVLHSFNEDQFKSFSRSKSVENYELITFHTPISNIELRENGLYILSSSAIFHYHVLDSKKLLLNCRSQEIYQIYKNYGDIEFMVKYFQLLTENEDVSRLDGLCKNESIKSHALFIWIYSLIRPVWNIDLSSLSGQDESMANQTLLDEIIKKLKILKQRLGYGFDSAKLFIDEFIQTYFYITFLLDYNVDFKESFNSILTQDSEFKTVSLKNLLDAFTVNQSIEPLLKTMQNGCPMYLPLENINFQRGVQLIKKDDKESLLKSLNYLSQARFDQGIIQKFNELKFFYGSIFLIRENFVLDYEKAVELFIESVKCKKALETGLEDSREAFLYPFFEAVIRLENFEPCICCDYTPSTVDILSIKNPLFSIFLKDQLYKNEKVCDLYWKYLLIKNEKLEAIQTLISLSQRANFPIQKKLDFLQTALSISTGTSMNSTVRIRLKLYEIQKEVELRNPSLKSFNLLDSDTLYNDYCYNYPDLKIKILDQIGFKDEKVIKNLFESYFSNLNLRECFVFLKELQSKNLNLVFDILIKKIKSATIDFCSGLAMAGFEYDEIVSFVKECLLSNIHPDIKVELLKSFKLFSKFGEYVEYEKLCEKDFGIRIIK